MAGLPDDDVIVVGWLCRRYAALFTLPALFVFVLIVRGVTANGQQGVNLRDGRGCKKGNALMPRPYPTEAPEKALKQYEPSEKNAPVRTRTCTLGNASNFSGSQLIASLQ